ncbi:hypothetical protein G9C98_002372 [Cotesia typhae]|uniref:Clusterin-associated protein 1 n=1 Tax=Cotesia typhae TaxID=2053667 RepID=A0A8J5R9N6_9HYME|nr:hypothetical protein G9C98_002372 [Cotesia typhae]
MSCRDLRNFTETMRFLGYPRLISLSNFRVPNFSLVAEILVWLIHRFDPDSDMTADYETVENRVSIIRRAAEFIAIKINIKLNTKKLYQADGHAVNELLKIATALYEAQNKNAEDEIMSGEMLNPLVIDITDELSELKITRQMASQLTVSGASLFDLLGREVQLREVRNNKAVRQFDTSQIEVALKDVIDSMKKDIDDTRRQIDNVKETEQNLETKIERRQMELERNKKRLVTLRKVRPAFMEEFEKFEVELKGVYDNYLQKCRYLAYLEHLYEDMTKVEQEKFEQRQAATKRQLEQLRGEDVSFETIMEGNDSIFTNNIRPLNLDEAERSSDKNDQPGEITGRASRVQLNQRRIYGTMSGRPRGLRESNDSIGSLDDSDSDLLIDGDLDDDEEDDDIDIENVGGNLLNSVTSHEIAASLDFKGNSEKISISKAGHVDEDF